MLKKKLCPLVLSCSFWWKMTTSSLFFLFFCSYTRHLSRLTVTYFYYRTSKKPWPTSRYSGVLLHPYCTPASPLPLSLDILNICFLTFLGRLRWCWNTKKKKKRCESFNPDDLILNLGHSCKGVKVASITDMWEFKRSRSRKHEDGGDTSLFLIRRWCQYKAYMQKWDM